MKRLFDLVVSGLCVVITGCGSSAKQVGSAGSGGGAGANGGSAGANAGTGGVKGDAAVDGGSCSFTPCGGNIVGTWHFASACGSISNSRCPPPQAIIIEHETSQATYTFGSDASYTSVFSGAFTQTARYPFACLSGVTDGGTSQICADYQKMVQASFAQADAGTLAGTYTCSMEVNQTCVCNEAFTIPTPRTETGSYLVSGDHVTITASVDGGVGDAGAPASVGYCVSGNTLALHLTGDNDASDFVLTFTR